MTRERHPGWEEELMPYVDGQLDAKQASAVAEHVKTCQECADVVADAQRLSQQVKTWEVEESPERVREQVFAEMQGQRAVRPSAKPAPWWNNRAWSYGLAGALSVAVLVIVLSVGTGQSTNDAFLIPPSENLRDHFELEQDQNLQLLKKEGQQGQQGQAAKQGQPQSGTVGKLLPAEPSGPMVIRTARLTLLSKEFDSARSRIETIVRQSQGYLDELTIVGEAGSARTLSASLRLPSDRLDSGLAELRQLGRVREESQGSSDVTSQYVDLQARLTNARNTEQRLLALQRERTDKLVDVVNVEREISRVREEIERMVAQQKDMSNRVQYATIQLSVAEEYRAEIQSPATSAGTQLRNASIDGYRGALDSLLAVALFALRHGPMLLLWAAVLVPVVILARRLQMRLGRLS